MFKHLQHQPVEAIKPEKLPRIIVLTEVYYPEQTSTGYLLTKTAEGLAENYRVIAITGPATNFFQKVGCPAHEVKDNVEIFRCQGTKFDRNLILGRLLNLVTCSTAIFWQALRVCQRGEILLVVTNPPLLPFIGLLLKWIKSCRLVLLIHDVYPEVLVASQISSPSSAIVKLGAIANRMLYNRASKIITLGRDMTKLAQAKLTNDRENVVCIPNWADREIAPAKRQENPLLKELCIADKFVVLYAGNMGRTHGIENLAEAAKILKNNSNIHFVFLGFGAKQKWLEEYVREKNLTSVSILSPRPRSEQIIFLNACDVAIISFVPGMAGVSVPSRMYNQMAAGKPIIAVTDDWSELAEVVLEEKIGWVVKPGELDSLVRTIQFAAEHPQLCTEMGFRAAGVAQSKYTFTQANKSYKRLFKELFSSEVESQTIKDKF